MEAPPALYTPPQRPRSSSATTRSGGSVKQINSKVLRSDLPEGSRLTKEQLGLLLAVWAQNKPDCLYQREALYKRIREYKKRPKKDQDNIIPAANTGATLIDSNNMIMAVAGSGATHAAAYLCNRFPQQTRGGTICMSKRPCSFCLKMMIQCGVSRIIVPELKITSVECPEKWDQNVRGTITIHCVNVHGVRVESEKAGIVVEVHYEPTEGADFVELDSERVTCSHNLDQVIAGFTPTCACKHKVVVRQEQKVVFSKVIQVRRSPEESEDYAPSSQQSQETTESIPSSQLNPDGGLKSEEEQLAKLWESEPFKWPDSPDTMAERWGVMLKLLLPSNTAYSALDLTNDSSALVDDLLQLYSSYISMTELPDDADSMEVKRTQPLHECVHVWLLGLCVIMSMRSEDKQAKVGAVLAQVRPKELAFAKENSNALEKMTQFSIDVLGAGYNGSRKGALHRDYRFQGDDDKGKWVLHAEQNVFMFRSIDDTSKCTLYSTHSPCLQCSGIIREKQVKMVYFLDAYRPPPDLDEGHLCHHFTEKITRDVPIETLFRAIKEIKEGYPQIKRRLAKGGKQEAAPADQAGAAAGREKAEAAVLEATEREAMEIPAEDEEEEQETSTPKKRKSDAATKKRSAPATKKRAQPSPKGKKELDGNDDEEVKTEAETKGKKEGEEKERKRRAKKSKKTPRGMDGDGDDPDYEEGHE